MFKNWKVSVDIYPLGTEEGWSSLLRIGVGGNSEMKGDRIPAIFFHSGATTMHIASYLNGNANYIFNSAAISIHQWTTIVIQQQKGQFYHQLFVRDRDSIQFSRDRA
jgi:hypothetical protein